VRKYRTWLEEMSMKVGECAWRATKPPGRSKGGKSDRPLRDKRQLKVIDDPVHYGIVGEESDDLHLAAVLDAEQWVDLMNLLDMAGQAWEGGHLRFFSTMGKHVQVYSYFLDLTFVSIKVKAIGP
jgi:hypothetical protein